MQTRTEGSSSHVRAAQPFFSARPSSAPAFFAPMVQAKCAECAEEDGLQRQLEPEEERTPDLQLKVEPDAGLSSERALLVQRKCAECAEEDRLQRQLEPEEERTPELQLKADADARLGSGRASLVQRKCAACEAEKSILPQLEVGRVDDPLETEADVMADHVVRRQAADVDGNVANPFPSVQRSPATSFFSQSPFARATRTPPNASAAICGNSPPALQRTCAACQADTRGPSQLEVGRVDDPLETEADVMADQVVRRQAAAGDDDERQTKRLQANARDEASSESTTPGLENALAHANGSGAPLARHTRDEMEEAFGADFSAVRVHTNAASAAMNEQIGARAFTYGTDIHFNDGEFAPGTERGTHLLAHELTHVVQQNSGVRRAPKRIQAKVLVFGPPSGIPSGTQIHNYGVLPLFKAVGLNPGLWVEPAIPGADKDKVGRGRTGYPDFYRDNAPNGVPIGINEGKLGGFTRIGVAAAAPTPPATAGGSVRDLDNAPKKIELGDLKPGNSPEETLGKRQLANYSKGITNTAEAVNDYQQTRSHADRWDPLPDPKPMNHLDVPDKLARSSSSGVRYSTLDVWEWRGKAFRYASTSLKGSLIVYKSSVDGIWAYEWMPENVPETLGDDFQLQKLLKRLNEDVKPRLDADKKTAPKLKNRTGAHVLRRHRRQRSAAHLLQRKPKKHTPFDEKGWLGAYNPWRTDADKALGESKTKDNEAVLEALTEGKKRTGFDPKIPQKVQERAKGFATLRHWIRYGRLYGWFRKTFDRVYVKLAGFAQKIKDKVRKLTRSAGSSGFGNWVKAAALALFKVAKKLGAWAVSIIVDKLLDSLQEGVINAVKKLAEEATPENVKSKIQEVEDLKVKYEQMLQEAQDDLEKRLFGDKLEMFTKLDKYMQIANTVSTIVSVVKWGIRIVACASPPLLGCLWNLAIAALEFAFAKIMETCWFSAKVFGWIRDSGIRAILDFPSEVAQAIANKGNEVLPLPEGVGPLFAPITVNHNEFNIDCSGGGDGDGDGDGGGPEPTEEQKALMDLAKEVGDEKLEAFLEMAAKRAADYSVALDAERIRKLGPLIKSLTIDQMKQLAANQPTEGVPVPVEEFLKSIATLTQAESERKAARKIDYDKAQRSNPKFERDQIHWKPELFVKSGIASDSKEFADAIYDIQKILGIRADGMAGPSTTKAFYERNNLPKDGAYENAVELVEAEKQARAARREAAARKKEIEALLKDEKVRAAMAAPFPSEDQLKKDLTSLRWENLADGGAAFVKVGERPIIAIKTDSGHRLGAYFHFVEREDKGLKKTMMLDTSRFYAFDTIPKNEMITFSIVDPDGQHGLWFMALDGQKQDTFSPASLRFFSLFVEFE